MSASNVNTNALLNPPREPGLKCVATIDFLSWALPVFAALLSVAGGIAALESMDTPAAILGILGGIASAAGVIFTGWASRIRDGRLAITHALGELVFDMEQHTQSMLPPGFGG